MQFRKTNYKVWNFFFSRNKNSHSLQFLPCYLCKQVAISIFGRTKNDTQCVLCQQVAIFIFRTKNDTQCVLCQQVVIFIFGRTKNDTLCVLYKYVAISIFGRTKNDTQCFLCKCIPDSETYNNQHLKIIYRRLVLFGKSSPERFWVFPSEISEIFFRI